MTKLKLWMTKLKALMKRWKAGLLNKKTMRAGTALMLCVCAILSCCVSGAYALTEEELEYLTQNRYDVFGGIACIPAEPYNEYAMPIDDIREYVKVLKEGVPEGKAGTVERMYLTCEGETCVAGVYLPNRYDAEDRETVYDVIVWQQGMDALNKPNPLKFLVEAKAANACDWLIMNGMLDPVIVLDVPEVYSRHGTFISIMLKELAERYNVYTEENVPEGDEVRNHYALIGSSSGASYAISRGIGKNYDKFANYGFLTYLSSKDFADYVKRIFDESGLRMNVAVVSAGNKTDRWGNKEQNANIGAERRFATLKNYADYAERWTYDGAIHGDSDGALMSFARFATLCYGCLRQEKAEPETESGCDTWVYRESAELLEP